MSRISKWFVRSEVACKCGCGLDSMDIQTLWIADEVRDFVGKPVVVSSGHRCHVHNLNVGGRLDSQHLHARAMDLMVDDSEEVFKFLCAKYPDKYGFGLYKEFVHIDTKTGTGRRWMKA